MKSDQQSPWFSRLLKRETPKKAGEPELFTPRLVLRPPVLADARDFFAYASNPQVARYVLWYPHESPGYSRQVLRSMVTRDRMEGLHTYALALKSDRRMIGTIGLVHLDPENGAAEVGFSMSNQFWGQGLMTEALKAYLHAAFTRWGLHRVEAQHDALNPASGRVMEKAGMKREGVLRERMFYKGRYADMVMYAAIKEDWLGVSLASRQTMPVSKMNR